MIKGAVGREGAVGIEGEEVVVSGARSADQGDEVGFESIGVDHLYDAHHGAGGLVLGDG